MPLFRILYYEDGKTSIYVKNSDTLNTAMLELMNGNLNGKLPDSENLSPVLKQVFISLKYTSGQN